MAVSKEYLRDQILCMKMQGCSDLEIRGAVRLTKNTVNKGLQTPRILGTKEAKTAIKCFLNGDIDGVCLSLMGTSGFAIPKK